MALREIVKDLLERFDHWRQVVSNPEQFLQPAFQPSEDQLSDGIEFYLTMFIVSFVFFAPLALAAKGEVADKTKMAINGALGLLFTGLISMTWYAAFWLLGGKSNFTGTLVAYFYAAPPYMPLTAFCSLILFAGLPAHLRTYALNPATANAAMKVAAEDPTSSKGMLALGSLGALGVIAWSAYIVFRCFSFIHEITGWKLAGAVLLSLVFSAPVSAVLQKVATLFQGSSGLDAGSPQYR